MSDAERINLRVGNKPKHFQRTITFDNVVSIIKAKEYDEYVTNGLIKVAKRYPSNALTSFLRNMDVYAANVKKTKNNGK